MSKKDRTVTLVKANSFEELDELSGPAVVNGDEYWAQCFRLLDFWYLMRGMDPEAQRVDRTRLTKAVMPWTVPNQKTRGLDFDT